ncbi:MAG: hypothetical protein ACE5FZ_05440 [Nitrospiria bacterium]
MRLLSPIGFIVLLILSVFAFIPEGVANELSGYAAVEGRLFFYDQRHPGQREQQGSIAAQPEYFHEWKESSFTAVPFFRLDSADSRRSHVDIREFFFLWYPESFELGVGIRKVFWGVTESQHLVDIINQTDLVELPDGEEKLGQPMINLSILRDWGILDVYLLPYFRERTFPGLKGRLRFPLVVDTDQTQYESGAKQHHFDVAARYGQTFGDWDVGLSHFQGTGREPSLVPGRDASGSPVLIPRYEQIGQTGLELQKVAEAWLWKLELIHRVGQGDSFEAWTGGFEYTFSAIFRTKIDLGIIGEWLHDSRGNAATTPFEEDLMAGARLALNDMASTELLFGMIQDLDHSARIFSLEASRRLTEHWKIEVEALIFNQQSPGELLSSQGDDDFLQASLFYHF